MPLYNDLITEYNLSENTAITIEAFIENYYDGIASHDTMLIQIAAITTLMCGEDDAQFNGLKRLYSRMLF